MRIQTVLLVCVLAATGCYTHKIDTFEKWCEKATGVNIERKYSPFWAVFFGVSLNDDATRDDFVRFLNATYMEKVEHRAPRMVWREGTDLHVVNLSSLMVIEPEKIISAWTRGIEASIKGSHKDPADICLYGVVVTFFETMTIHSMTTDALGVRWNDNITVIPISPLERVQRMKEQRR